MLKNNLIAVLDKELHKSDIYGEKAFENKDFDLVHRI